MKKVPTSILSRGGKLLKLTTQMVGKEIISKLPSPLESKARELNLRIEQTQLLVEALSEMKGAAMKMGQLLSLEADDIFPPEVLNILAKLQNESHYLEMTEIEKVLMAEWGQDLRSKVKVESRPLASASIGQVHKAHFEGKDIALKIQYPGVEKTIASDLKMMHILSNRLLQLTGKKVELTELFSELETTLLQETDYKTELEYMKEYKANMSALKAVIVPSANEALTTSRVLAMSFEKGLSFRDWIETRPSRSEREYFGHLFLEIYVHEFLKHGLVQTDPNFGNFLFRPYDEQLVLLDFGSCKRYDPEYISHYQDILLSTWNRDHQKLLSMSYDFGLISPKESDESKELYVQMMETILAPFRDRDTIFSFADQDYTKSTRQIGWKFAQSLKYSAPPKNLLFLHRKLGGVFNLLKRLDVSLNLAPYWDEMVSKER